MKLPLCSALLVVIAAATSSLVGCSNATGDDTDPQSSDSEVKKKVSPTGGNGAIEIVGPSWVTREMFDRSSYNIGSAPMFTGRLERAPGRYTVTSAGILHNAINVDVSAGQVTKVTASALQVRYAEPVTLGGANLRFERPDGQFLGELGPADRFRGEAAGVTAFVFPTEIVAKSTLEAAPRSVTVTEGHLAELVIPTARVKLALDAIDPAYPTPSACKMPTITFEVEDASVSPATDVAPIRQADGTPNASFVVPHGARTAVVLRAHGVEQKTKTAASGTLNVTLNRLEIDDVQVAQSNGQTTSVRGSVRIARKRDGSPTVDLWDVLACQFASHSGIDVPDGTYQVTTTAQTSSGTVSHTEEISFP